MRGLTKEYVIRRLFMYVLTIWLGSTLIFLIPRMVPGDPIAAMVTRMQQQAGYVENSAEIIAAWRARFGLDAPLPIQYLRFLRNSVTLDLGYSLTQFPTKVTEQISEIAAVDHRPARTCYADFIYPRQHHRGADGVA